MYQRPLTFALLCLLISAANSSTAEFPTTAPSPASFNTSQENSTISSSSSSSTPSSPSPTPPPSSSSPSSSSSSSSSSPSLSSSPALSSSSSSPSLSSSPSSSSSTKPSATTTAGTSTSPSSSYQSTSSSLSSSASATTTISSSSSRSSSSEAQTTTATAYQKPREMNDPTYPAMVAAIVSGFCLLVVLILFLLIMALAYRYLGKKEPPQVDLVRKPKKGTAPFYTGQEPHSAQQLVSSMSITSFGSSASDPRLDNHITTSPGVHYNRGFDVDHHPSGHGNTGNGNEDVFKPIQIIAADVNPRASSTRV